jgi:hypothetical protein
MIASSSDENCFAEIMTSTVDVKDDSRARPIQKAKVNISPSKK